MTSSGVILTFRRGVGAFKRKENAENDENGNETKDEKAKDGKKYRLRETDKRLSRARKITNGKFLLFVVVVVFVVNNI